MNKLCDNIIHCNIQVRRQEKNLSGKIRTTVKSKREKEMENFRLQQQVRLEIDNILKELSIWFKNIVSSLKGTNENASSKFDLFVHIHIILFI